MPPMPESPQIKTPDRQPRPQPRLTEAKLKLMIEAYKSGASVNQLTKEYGYCRDTIMRHFSAAGIRSRVATPTDEEIFHWRELRAEGLGFKAIAKRTGRNHKTVRKYLVASSDS